MFVLRVEERVVSGNRRALERDMCLPQQDNVTVHMNSVGKDIREAVELGTVDQAFSIAELKGGCHKKLPLQMLLDHHVIIYDY